MKRLDRSILDEKWRRKKEKQKAGTNGDVILSTKESSFHAWLEFFERFVKILATSPSFVPPPLPPLLATEPSAASIERRVQIDARISFSFSSLFILARGRNLIRRYADEPRGWRKVCPFEGKSPAEVAAR